jgi:hypothetical protein
MTGGRTTRPYFQPRAKTTGRGRDRAPMTVWWMEHGHPDLFTEFEQPVEVRAAIDLNILRPREAEPPIAIPYRRPSCRPT